jgi:hypothetical protein
MLENRITKEREIAEFTKDAQRLAFALECAFKIPAWLAPLPRLNDLNGGTPDIHGSIAESLRKFNLVRKELQSHHDRILDWCRQAGADVDPYARIAEREAQHLNRINPKITEARGDYRARRAILQRILRILQRLSEPTRQLLAAQVRNSGVFANSADANRLIFEQ